MNRLRAVHWWTLIAVLLYLAQAIALLDRMQDDAYISFRYAAHLAQGEGLRFNAGMEPVEGYSNFLWVVLLAGGLKIGISPVIFSKILGILAGALCVALATRVVHRWFADRSLGGSLVSGICCALSWYVALSSVEGLETMMVSLFVLAGVVRLVKELEEPTRRPLFWIWFLLAGLTRPEMPLLMIAALAILAISILSRQRTARYLLVTLGLYASFYAMYLVWKLFYFHDLLPNTFYAKVPDHPLPYLRGIRYLAGYAFGPSPPYGLLLSVALVTVVGSGIRTFRRERRVSEALLIPSFVLAYCLFVIAAGGDWMTGFRFVMPVVMLISLIIVRATLELERLLQRWPLLRSGVLVIILGIVIHVRLVGEWNYRWDESGQRAIGEQQSWYARPRVPETNTNGPHYTVARWVDSNFTPSSVIALSEAGVIPYYARQPILDYLGLNDRAIGRLYYRQSTPREVSEAMLDRRPDGIVMAAYTNSAHSRVRGRLPIEEALLADTGFIENYRVLYAKPIVNRRPEGTDTSFFLSFLVYGKLIPIPGLPAGEGSSPVIDGLHGEHQLGAGWHAVEGDSENAFRWTKASADFSLPLLAGRRTIAIDAFAPSVELYKRTTIRVRIGVSGGAVLDTVLNRAGSVRLIVPLPQDEPRTGCWRGTIQVDTLVHESGRQRDRRQLGIVVRRIALS